MLEVLLCKLVRWAWQDEYLLEVLPAGLSCTGSTSSPGLWQCPHGTASTRWSRTRCFSPWWCHQSCVSSGACCCLFSGRTCPWEEEVWCWVQKWSGKHTKWDIKQLRIPGWKSYSAWRSCILTINPRCSTHLCLKSQSSLTALWESPWFVWFKMAQLQF